MLISCISGNLGLDVDKGVAQEFGVKHRLMPVGWLLTVDRPWGLPLLPAALNPHLFPKRGHGLWHRLMLQGS